MKKCFSSATEYISVKDEKLLTHQALKIAISARVKKQKVYLKSNEATQNSSYSHLLTTSMR